MAFVMRVLGMGPVLSRTPPRSRSGQAARVARGATSSPKPVPRVGVPVFPDLTSRFPKAANPPFLCTLGNGDGGSGGGGGGFGDGNGGGGGDWNDDTRGDDHHERPRTTPRVVALALATSMGASYLMPKSAHAGDKDDGTTSSPSDLGVCFLYGFTWFYGVKLFLKTAFSPLMLFFGTMTILTKTNVLPESLAREAYEAYVKPRIPKEWKKDLSAPVETAVDDRVRDMEKRFWKFVKRVLPACSTPTAEKAFFAGIILAGLA
jgi:hypothetical protein